MGAWCPYLILNKLFVKHSVPPGGRYERKVEDKMFKNVMLIFFCSFVCFVANAGTYGKYNYLKTARQGWGIFKASHYLPERDCGFYDVTRVRQNSHEPRSLTSTTNLSSRRWARRLNLCEVIVITEVESDIKAREEIDIGRLELGDMNSHRVSQIIVGKSMWAPTISVGTINGRLPKERDAFFSFDNLQNSDW